MPVTTTTVPDEIIEIAELLKTVASPDPLDESMHVFCGTSSAVMTYFIRCGIENVLRLAIIEYNSSCDRFHA